MKKIPIVLTLIFMLQVYLIAQSDADNLFSKGRDAFSAKSYDTALGDFDAFLKAYPDDPRADGVNYMRSVSYFYLRRYPESIDSFRLFEGKYKTSAYVARMYYWLGLCYYALKDYDQAAENFLKQTGYKSESFFVSRSYLYLGESYEKASKPEKAAEAYKQGILAGGEEKIVSQSRLKLGILLFNDGDYSGAVDQFSEIIDNSIDTTLVSDSQYYVGESLYHMGILTEAASKLQFYLFMSSGNRYRESAIFRLGDIYSALGKTDEAVKYLQLLKSDYPDGKYYLEGLRVLGKTWNAAGNYDKAAEVYKEIISLSKDQTEIQNYYYELAQTRIDSKKPMEAVPFLKNSLKGPDTEKQMMSLYYLGQILMDQGMQDDGANYLRELISKFPDSDAADDASATLADYLTAKGDKQALAAFIDIQLSRKSKYLDRFLFIKGNLDEENKNDTEALKDYDRIINEFPDSTFLSEALHRKANILVRSDKGKEALPLYDEALQDAETDKEKTDIQVDKALLLYDMGNKDEADAAFKTLLEKDVDFPRKGEILYRQGQLSFDARNYSEAAEYFRRSAEASTGDRVNDAHFKEGECYFNLLNYKTSERLFSDLADNLNATSDKKLEAMKMADFSIFLQQDWSRSLQYSDLLITSLGVYPDQIRLIKLLSQLALGRNDAYAKEIDGIPDNSENKLFRETMKLVGKAGDPSTIMLSFRSLLSAYPDDSAGDLAVLLITDLMYIVPDGKWIETTYKTLDPLLQEGVLKIGFNQAYQMNANRVKVDKTTTDKTTTAQ